MNLRSTSILAICTALLVSAGCTIRRDHTVRHTETTTLKHEMHTVSGEESLSTTGDNSPIEVTTRNGWVKVDGSGKPGSTDVRIIMTAKAPTAKGANDALNAIEIVEDQASSGKTTLSWKWKSNKKPGWQGSVCFEITCPSSKPITVETRNGHVEVRNIEANVDLLSRNGRIIVDAKGESLRAETHNGQIEATFAGPDVDLLSHNGKVRADLRGFGQPSGSIVAHNGHIEVVLDDEAAVRLCGKTRNGTISCKIPGEAKIKSDRELTLDLNKGTSVLEMETHNGSIRIW